MHLIKELRNFFGNNVASFCFRSSHFVEVPEIEQNAASCNVL